MSDPETAICCMIVSNPGGDQRPHAWQKRVNDHMRRLAAEVTRLRGELNAANNDANKWCILQNKEQVLAEALTAKLATVTAEQEQLLADSAIRSDQRVKYEKLCNELATSPRLAQQEAIDAIKALCRDNERLALLAGKNRARADAAKAALRKHHDWHLSQDRDGNAWGIDQVDAYSESGLCEETIAVLEAGQ